MHFYNIPESVQETNEESVQKVKQVLSNLGTPSEVQFHAIQHTVKSNINYRASFTSGEPRPRPILARFVSHMDSKSNWFKRKELHKSPRFSTVLIDKDLHLNRQENEQNSELPTRKLRI